MPSDTRPCDMCNKELTVKSAVQAAVLDDSTHVLFCSGACREAFLSWSWTTLDKR